MSQYASIILKRLRPVAKTLPSASASSAESTCKPAPSRVMGMKQQAEQFPAAAVQSSSPSKCNSTCKGCEMKQTGAGLTTLAHTHCSSVVAAVELEEVDTATPSLSVMTCNTAYSSPSGTRMSLPSTKRHKHEPQYRIHRGMLTSTPAAPPSATA
jgi:hypothetical protein